MKKAKEQRDLIISADGRKYNVTPLIRARLEQRWSLEFVAIKVGRTANMIYKIEHGANTSEEVIFAMSKALGVPMREILTEDDDAA